MQVSLRPTLDPHAARGIWSGMHKRIVADGVTDGAAPVAWLRFTAFTAMLGVVLMVVWTQTTAFALALGTVAITLLLAQFAFLGHDAGHGGLHRSTRLNTLLGQLSMTVVTGLAFGEWYARHATHHRYCQDASRDPDMDVDMVASLTVESARTKGPLGRWFTRQQGWLLWLLSMLFAHSQRVLAQWGALRQPVQYWRDLLFLALHFGLWFGIPLGVLGADLRTVVAVYVLPLFLLGPYLAAIFWLNHVGMPLVRDTEGLSFLEHQSATSRTITNPRAMDWFFGGLNYQIEHHLFPRVPSFRLHRVQRVVQSAFSEHGVPYNASGFIDAVYCVAQHFRAVARAA